MNSMRIIFALFIAIAIFIVITYYTFSNNNELSLEILNTLEPNTKIILLWTAFFGQTNWVPKSLESINCPETRCIITESKDLAARSDGIVFHWRDVDLGDLPPRRPEQLWYLFNKESPLHTPKNILEGMAPLINQTITYRLDSTIVSPYGRIVKLPKLIKKNITQKLNRGGAVAWLVSDCKTPSNRESFVKELGKYIPIKIKGRCGDGRCPYSSPLDCLKKLSDSNYFYLSFENSICKDYTTEKLFNALESNMIPIVFGGADYKHLLPPHSFINALDFKSPKALASHLLLLMSNKTSYQNYFNWQREYEVQQTPYHWLCDVCQQLHKDSSHQMRRLPQNLVTWWFEDANCTSWTR